MQIEPNFSLGELKLGSNPTRRRYRNKNLIKLLEDAKSSQLSEFPHRSESMLGIAPKPLLNVSILTIEL